MATSALILHHRRPLHTVFRRSLYHPHAGKRRCRRLYATRTRPAAQRSYSGQQHSYGKKHLSRREKPERKMENFSFARIRPKTFCLYRRTESFPGRHGTLRRNGKKPEKAFAQWIPDIPETGKYAVYVSYQTLPGSVSDAKYLVFHKGGVTEFKVNQQMGGGTWVYLGTFEFDKGTNDYGMVVLSNESKQKE